MNSSKTTQFPDPRTLSTLQLIHLIVEVSKSFTAKLQDCVDIEELHDLRFYMQAVTAELERKQLAEIERQH